MSDEGTVNTQVIDATSDIVTLLTGQSPAQSFAMLDAVMVETLGMAMHNAVHRQQNPGMGNSPAVTAPCAKMLSGPFPLSLLHTLTLRRSTPWHARSAPPAYTK
ncbi:RebB family R body protein, partial [Azospirillum formosense]|uniref:RebB family R body protein n=1 Tax=Azospirillum formosense TaxID=861533 RepID=UPI001FFEB1C3